MSMGGTKKDGKKNQFFDMYVCAREQATVQRKLFVQFFSFFVECVEYEVFRPASFLSIP